MWQICHNQSRTRNLGDSGRFNVVRLVCRSSSRIRAVLMATKRRLPPRRSVNARLKDEFGGRHVRVRGHAKVYCHLMFGVLALAVDQLMQLVT